MRQSYYKPSIVNDFELSIADYIFNGHYYEYIGSPHHVHRACLATRYPVSITKLGSAVRRLNTVGFGAPSSKEARGTEVVGYCLLFLHPLARFRRFRVFLVGRRRKLKVHHHRRRRRRSGGQRRQSS